MASEETIIEKTSPPSRASLFSRTIDSNVGQSSVPETIGGIVDETKKFTYTPGNRMTEHFEDRREDPVQEYTPYDDRKSALHLGGWAAGYNKAIGNDDIPPDDPQPAALPPYDPAIPSMHRGMPKFIPDADGGYTDLGVLESGMEEYPLNQNQFNIMGSEVAEEEGKDVKPSKTTKGKTSDPVQDLKATAQHMHERIMELDSLGFKFEDLATVRGLKAMFSDGKETTSTGKSNVSKLDEAFLGVLRGAESTGLTGTAIKLYNDVIQRGRTEPITEKDLSPTDIEAFRAMVRAKVEATGRTSGSIQPEDYNRMKGKNPDYNILGRFDYEVGADGKIYITDQYDFNELSGGPDKSRDFPAVRALAAAVAPGVLAADIGRQRVPPGTGPNVQITLGNETAVSAGKESNIADIVEQGARELNKRSRGDPNHGLLLKEGPDKEVTVNAWNSMKRFMQTGDLKEAFKIAATLAGLGMVRGGLATESELGIFGGRLAKGKIRDNEPTHTGHEGLPRFEMDDSPARVLPDKVQYYTNTTTLAENAAMQKKFIPLKDIYVHDRLYEAYPELAKVKINAIVKDGAYYPPRASITGDTITARASSLDELKKTIGHEVQHWIQRKEGFEPGANWMQFFTKELKDGVRNTVEKGDFSGLSKADQRHLVTAVNLKDGRVHAKTIEDVVAWYKANPSVAQDNANMLAVSVAEGKYRHVAGEVEARNTFDRTDMTAQERMDKPAYTTEDTLPKDMTFPSFSRKAANDARMDQMSGGVTPKPLSGNPDLGKAGKFKQSDVAKMNWDELNYHKEILEARLAKVENRRENGSIQERLRLLDAQLEMHARGMRDFPGGVEGKAKSLSAAAIEGEDTPVDAFKFLVSQSNTVPNGSDVVGMLKASGIEAHTTREGKVYFKANAEDAKGWEEAAKGMRWRATQEPDGFVVLEPGVKIKGNRAAQRESGDTISRDPAQVEFDFSQSRSAQAAEALKQRSEARNQVHEDVKRWIGVIDTVRAGKEPLSQKEYFRRVRERFPDLPLSDHVIKRAIYEVRNAAEPEMAPGRGTLATQIDDLREQMKETASPSRKKIIQKRIDELRKEMDDHTGRGPST